MKTFVVTGLVATVHTGRVRLSESQARRRRNLVRQIEGDVYAVTDRIQFKHGEEFGYDGEFPKSMAEQIKPAQQTANTELDLRHPPARRRKEKSVKGALRKMLHLPEGVGEGGDPPAGDPGAAGAPPAEEGSDGRSEGTEETKTADRTGNTELDLEHPQASNGDGGDPPAGDPGAAGAPPAEEGSDGRAEDGQT